jgi:hypothetical protein
LSHTRFHNIKLFDNEEFDAAKLLVNDMVAEGTLEIVGRQNGYKPLCRFMVHNDPVLNGIISHAILTRLDKGIASMELKESIVTEIAILYRALFATWNIIEYRKEDGVATRTRFLHIPPPS